MNAETRKNLPPVSVVVSTYNRPEALVLILKALARQTLLPAEVVIGDDGSRPDTREVIDSLRPTMPFPIVHIWHEDTGFRLAEIRNKATAAAKGDYIIQIDGDILPERHFVEDHARLARPGHFIRGTRLWLTEDYTRRLEESGTPPRHIGIFNPGICRNRIKALRLPWPGFAKSPSYRRFHRGGIGANMSFWKSDFMAVNGYDETFVGWGGEDTDLMHRLTRAGIRSFKTFHLAMAFHLYHREAVNPNLYKVLAILADKERRGETITPNGITKLPR